MGGNPYNSVLRSGLTRRLWLIIALAMLIPVSIAVLSRWFEAEERRARLQNQELTALSRDKASTLMFSARVVPDRFDDGLDGRFLVVLDGCRHPSLPQQPGARRSRAVLQSSRAERLRCARAARRSSRGSRRAGNGAAR
jgi:hypothetical protein